MPEGVARSDGGSGGRAVTAQQARVANKAERAMAGRPVGFVTMGGLRGERKDARILAHTADGRLAPDDDAGAAPDAAVSLGVMNTPAAPRLLSVDPTQPDDAALAPAAAALAGGALVAFPTETVYGLGANAWNAVAVARVFAVKGRPLADPLIVHVLDWAAARPLIHPDAFAAAADGASAVARAARLAAAFWPGPLTLVLPSHPRLPGLVTAGQDSVALRAPAHPVARALLRLAAVPVAAPSANPFGGISPTCAADVLEDLGAGVDWIVDGGPATLGLESTVVDCRGSRPRVLRPGGLTVEALRAVLPDVAGPGGLDETPDPAPDLAAAQVSPGLMARHYAPRTAALSLFIGTPAAQRAAMAVAAAAEAAAGRRVALLVPVEDAADLAEILHSWSDRVEVVALGGREDLAGVARGLYAGLRRLDESGFAVILAADLGAEGLGLAIRDRLSRAAEGRVIRV
jgi:L-threonylcarbamoyladenylate synthase